MCLLHNLCNLDALNVTSYEAALKVVVKREIVIQTVGQKKIEILLTKILLIAAYFFCAVFHPLTSAN
jgi:hypothetical protein